MTASPARRRELALLAILLILAAALRLRGLTHGLRIDEIEAWARAQYPLKDLFGTVTLPHAPLLLRATMLLLGDAEWALRLPSVLCGVLTVAATWLLGRRLFDATTGLAAAALLAVSPLHIAYSQEARYYALFLLYSTVALWLLLALLEAPQAPSGRRGLLGACLAACLGLNLLTHYFALYPLVLCAASALMRRGPREVLAQALAAPRAAAAAAVVAAPLAVYYPRFFAWQSGGTKTLAASYLEWFQSHDSLWADLATAFGGGGACAVLLSMFILLGLLLRRRESIRSYLDLALWTALPLVSLIIIKSKTHFELRYFIFLLPPLLIAAAAGMTVAARRFSGKAAFAALPVLAAVFLQAPTLFAHYALPWSRIREAYGHIRQNCAPGDAALLYPEWRANGYGYYPLGPCPLYGPAAAARLAERYERVWLGGTWIADLRRRAEFDRIRAGLARSYALEKRLSWPSRVSNDESHLYLYRRVKAKTAAGTVVPRALPRRRGAVRFFGNIPEMLEEEPLRSGLLRVVEIEGLSRVEVWRVRGSTALAGDDDHALFVWDGSGRLSWEGGAAFLGAGDAILAPGGRSYRAEVAGAALTLLRLSLPRCAGAAPAVLRRGRAPAPARAENILLCEARGVRLRLVRLPPAASLRALDTPWLSYPAKTLFVPLSGSARATLEFGEPSWFERGDIRLPRTDDRALPWRSAVGRLEASESGAEVLLLQGAPRK